MKKSVYLSMLALSAIVFSCKKDKDKSAQELILGKWNYLGWTDNQHYSNEDHRDTAIYQVGYKTFEFLNNGVVVDKGTNYVDSMAYKFEGSKLLVSSNAARTKFDTFTVKTLTGSDLQLYTKKVYSNGDYYENTDNLKR
jgi:hypothetical protein